MQQRRSFALQLGLLAAISQVACYTVCEEYSGPEVVGLRSDQFIPHPDGTFSVDHVEYKDCEAFCRSLPILEFHGCQPPKPFAHNYFAWQIECDVTFATCRDEGGIDVGSGRCPEKTRLIEGVSASSAGAYFAAAASIEHASIQGFADLAMELAAHDAPAHLIEGCIAAAWDEARHERIMRPIAARNGGGTARAEVPVHGVRSLEEIAIANAVEGCTGETVGAAILSLQSRRARDPRVSLALQSVARDEQRHGELSIAIQQWIVTRVGGSERRRIRDKHRNAFARLDARELEFRSHLARPVLGPVSRAEIEAIVDTLRPAA